MKLYIKSTQQFPKILIYDKDNQKYSYSDLLGPRFKSNLLAALKDIQFDDESSQINAIRSDIPRKFREARISCTELGSYEYEIELDDVTYILKISGIGSAFNNGLEDVDISKLLN